MRITSLCESVQKKTGRRCTPAMVKNYEAQGLIPPPERTQGGTRSYSQEYVDRIARIIDLKSRYLRLESIKDILERERSRAGIPGGMLDADKVTGTDEDVEERKARIVEEALYHFNTRGYHNTKISEIAQSAGCGAGTIYSYFPSKQDLLMAVVDRITSIMEQLFIGIDDVEEDPIERTKLIGIAHLNLNRDINDIIFFLQAETMGEGTEFEKKADVFFDRYTNKVRENLREAVEKGMIRDVDPYVLSYGLLGMVPMIGSRLRHDDRYTPEVIIEKLADILLYGVLPR